LQIHHKHIANGHLHERDCFDHFLRDQAGQCGTKRRYFDVQKTNERSTRWRTRRRISTWMKEPPINSCVHLLQKLRLLFSGVGYITVKHLGDLFCIGCNTAPLVLQRKFVQHWNWARVPMRNIR
jgi:hypothetical protein